MLSLPSPAPTLCAIGTLGTLKPASALVPPPPPLSPLPSLPPHPAAANSAAHATAAAHVPRLIMVAPPHGTALRRSRTSAPSRHATLIRRPRSSCASADEVSRFWRTTCSSPPASSATRKRVTIPDVGDVAHRARLDVQALGGLALLQQADLLGPDREAPPVALDDVRDPHEAGDELVGRMLVDVGGRADLLDAPRAEHGQAVAHRQRLLLVVGDVDEGDADLALDALELDLHLLAQLEVQRAQRLVEQQHLRAVDDRPRQRDALALAAGELRRLARAVVAAGAPSRAPRSARARRSARGDLLDAQPVLDVLAHGHVREQRVVLEDRVDVARVGRAAA